MNVESQDELCELFQQFHQEYQHPFVPPYPEFHRLYTLSERARKQRAALSATTIACLDQHSFGWTATNRESRWMYNYFQLKQFHQANGHSNVPQYYASNKRLGTWSYQQRGRKEKLSPRQLTMLDELNFSWIDGSEVFPSPIYEERWNAMFEKLRAYKDEYGHPSVPSTYSDTSLARWVTRQRERVGQLSPEQFRRLEALGFVFDLRLQREMVWEYMYQQLVLFHQEEGHSQVPQHHANDRLANWVRSQRAAKDRLSKARLAKLAKVDFPFNADLETQRDQRWLSNFRKVKIFYQQEGQLSHPDSKLYRWVHRQKQRAPREAYRRVLLREIGIDHPD